MPIPSPRHRRSVHQLRTNPTPSTNICNLLSLFRRMKIDLPIPIEKVHGLDDRESLAVNRRNAPHQGALKKSLNGFAVLYLLLRSSHHVLPFLSRDHPAEFTWRVTTSQGDSSRAIFLISLASHSDDSILKRWNEHRGVGLSAEREVFPEPQLDQGSA